MGVLLLSGETINLKDWDVEEIIGKQPTKSQLIEQFESYERDNTIGPYCNGMTYLEIEQFNNTYNNFR